MSTRRDWLIMHDGPSDLLTVKQRLRQQAFALRRQQPAKDEASQVICRTFAALEEYRRAAVVMAYVGVRSEVRTRPFLPEVLQHGKTLVLPYCVGGELELFRVDSMDELTEGYFGLVEPLAELRDRPEKQVEAARLDLIMVPGVAFDQRGGRIGHGKGYYDRFLRHVRADACLVGVAFQCQIVPTVPMEPYDVPMHLVITEKDTYGSTGGGARDFSGPAAKGS